MVESENPHPRLSSHLHRPDPVSGSIPAHTGHNASHPKTTLQIEQLPREINQGSSPQKAFPWFSYLRNKTSSAILGFRNAQYFPNGCCAGQFIHTTSSLAPHLS